MTSHPERFAAVIRVSTEKQEEKGESLRVQNSDIRQVIDEFQSNIVEWYGGQEHATPDQERSELKRLLEDAQKTPRPFDAVIVHHADRWSRDNEASASGLRILKDAGIRYFYVLRDKHDLLDPNDEMRLGFHALIGQYFARNQKKKSIEARIHRAKRGVPVCGKLPFGRTFNAETEQWGIDEEKAVIIRDVARRYLNGESMSALAKEYGINHSYLHKTITQRCGPTWLQSFCANDLNINEQISTQVPELLDKVTIERILKKTKANRTYLHGEVKNRYLLSRVLFCAECGYALTGQTNHNGVRYYRHRRNGGAQDCPIHPRPWVQADVLERQVISKILDVYGNPTALERAMEEASPNPERLAELKKKKTRLLGQIEALNEQRQRVVRMVRKGHISEDEGDNEFATIRASISELEKGVIAVEREEQSFRPPEVRRKLSAKRTIKMEFATDPDRISFDDAKALIADVFGGELSDGSRMGVYIAPIDLGAGVKNRRFRFTIRGQVLESCHVLRCGTSSPLHSQGTVRLARRFL